MSEDLRALENGCLLTAVSLLAGEVDEQTQVGDLLVKRDGDVYDVHKEEDDLLIFVDSIQPSAYPSARVLGAYLRELQQIDAAKVDLPESPTEYVGPAVDP